MEKHNFADGSKHLVKAVTFKTGQTAKGNTWYNIGCVTPTPIGTKGVWHTYNVVVNKMNKEEIRKDMKRMGVTSLEPFESDQRLFIIEYGLHPFFKDIRVMKVHEATGGQQDVPGFPGVPPIEQDPF